MPGRDEDFMERLKQREFEARMRGEGGHIIQEGIVPPVIRSSHVTYLNNTVISLHGLADEDMVLMGYEIKLFDQVEHHLYSYKFDGSVRDTIMKFFSEVPDLGSKIDLDAEIS